MRRAIDASPADGRMDLLTVVMHELGHVLGLEDLEQEQSDHELMAEALDAGIRRLPSADTALVNARDHGRSPALAGETEVGHIAPTPTASESRMTGAGLVVLLPRKFVPGPQQFDTADSHPCPVTPSEDSRPGQPIRISGSPPRPGVVDVVLASLSEQLMTQDGHLVLLGRIKRSRRV
jgi:hypothetical protein